MAHGNHHLSEGEIALAHISDLHFGKSEEDEKAWKLLEQILRELKPSLLLVSGDLVDTPKRRHFDKAVQKLQGLEIPYRACLGNHDWYRYGNRFHHRLMFGNAWLPGGVLGDLATGRLGQLPSQRLVALGFLVLAVMPWCAPWLISRVWNAVGKNLFDENFRKQILGHTAAIDLKLPSSGDPEWTIGLLGIDSSAEADVSARGFVDSTYFLPLEMATRKKDWDLCICLIHHHLISISGLETSHEGDRLRLLNLTTLVNSGSLLEAMVRAQVDLVLHGHEHAPNWVTYNTCKPGYEPLRVVAAGSATGMGEGGYKSDRATFNLIILAPDRSVRLRRYFHSAGEWKTEEDVPLFNAAALRQSRLRRALAARQIFGELTKYVEYTRERDIWVYWEYRNWLLPKQEFVQRIWNTTGEPDDVTVHVWLANEAGDPHELKPTCVPVEDEKNAWDIHWPVNSDWIGNYARVRMGYRWRGGGVLTDEEMKRVRGGNLARGTPRLDGHEYETVWTSEVVAAAMLIVILPPEYAPDGPPSIRVDREIQIPASSPMLPPKKVRKQLPSEVSELRQYLSFPAKGKFSLRVPYPCPYYDYTLSWKPVSEATVAKRMANDLPERHFRKVAGEKGEDLLEAFANILEMRDPLGNVTLALYVREDILNDLTLVRTAWKRLGSDNGHVPEPPARIPFKGERQATTLAWWGQPQILARPDDEAEASAVGFAHPREQTLCGVPLRFNLQSVTNPPPWGLVRIAVIKDQGTGLQEPNVTGTLQKLLPAATTALLSAALQEDFQ